MVRLSGGLHQAASVTVVVLAVVAASLVLPAGVGATVTFGYETYHEIVEALHDLNNAHPGFMELYSAQDRYGLDSPGTCTGDSEPCLQWVAVLTEEATLPDRDRPEVFFSGNMHGDEQVGPLTLINFLRYVLAWRADPSHPAHAWVARLLATRVIIVMPVTNSQGYDHIRREENSVDPNRDFPYDQRPDHCMQTITARAVNEVWREHAVQLAVTFHGGMQAIAYEWGAPNHPAPQSESPDENGQRGVGLAMGAFAGEFRGDWYPVNRLNDIVYPVKGGMEDWGYASSWDTAMVQPCTPSTFGGYPASRTTYTSDMLRAFNILVETSDDKRPLASHMGTDAAILVPSGTGDGHVPRNMRIALAITDLVQPYLEITTLTGAVSAEASRQRRAMRGDVAARRLQGMCAGDGVGELQMSVEGPTFATTYLRTEMQPEGAQPSVPFGMSWDIGGALDVDETNLVWSEWPVGAPLASVFAGERADGPAAHEVPDDATVPAMWREFLAGGLDLGSPNLDAPAGTVFVSAAQSGVTKWKSTNGRNGPDLSQPFTPRFSDCVELPCSDDGEGRVYIVAARAKVDERWSRQHDPKPSIGPQSHVVNARTDDAWNREVAGHRVRGRTYWVSRPVFVTVGQLDCALSSASGAGSSDSGSGGVGGSSSSSGVGSGGGGIGSGGGGEGSSGSDGSVGESSSSSASGLDSLAGSGSDGEDGEAAKNVTDPALCADLHPQPRYPVDTAPIAEYVAVGVIVAVALVIVGGGVWVVRSNPSLRTRVCLRGGAAYRNLGPPRGAADGAAGEGGGGDSDEEVV